MGPVHWAHRGGINKMTYVRILNNQGKKEFLDLIVKIKENPSENISFEQFHEEPCSKLFVPQIEIENRSFLSRMEFGSHLNELFQEIPRSSLINNEGLWNWLTIFFIDQIAPVDPSGRRHLGESARYLYNPYYTRYYRHIVAASWDIYSKYQEKSKIFLQTPMNSTNKITLEFACRQNLISNDNMVDAITALYWHKRSDGSEGAKRGAVTKKAPGNLYRFIALMNQLELTYDVYSMSGKEILELLPPEFAKWKGIQLDAKKYRKKGILDFSQNRLMNR